MPMPLLKPRPHFTPFHSPHPLPLLISFTLCFILTPPTRFFWVCLAGVLAGTSALEISVQYFAEHLCPDPNTVGIELPAEPADQPAASVFPLSSFDDMDAVPNSPQRQRESSKGWEGSDAEEKSMLIQPDSPAKKVDPAPQKQVMLDGDAAAAFKRHSAKAHSGFAFSHPEGGTRHTRTMSFRGLSTAVTAFGNDKFDEGKVACTPTTTRTPPDTDVHLH